MIVYKVEEYFAQLMICLGSEENGMDKFPFKSNILGSIISLAK